MTDQRLLASAGPGALCKVCGDRASGKHYGVPSCDGCRGFFKRSIRRNLEYVCKEGSKCIVDVSRRNQCQACRFAKCLQANMRREAVQHERAPRSCMTNHNGLPTMSSIDLYTQRRLPLHPSGLIFPLPVQMHPPAFSPFGGTIDPPRYAPHLHQPPHHGFLETLNFGGGIFTPPASTLAKLQDNFLGISASHAKAAARTPSASEDEVSSSEEITTKLPTNSVEAIFESAAKLLFLAVKWVRSVPSFVQLSFKDQTSLLEDSWAELFVITAAYWGLPIESITQAPSEDLRQLLKAFSQIGSLRMDSTEVACLKSLVLFRTDCVTLSQNHQISYLQGQTLKLLLDKSGGTRVCHILLTLPAIKMAANPKALQELLFKKTVGEVAIERLLGDLIRT